MIATAIVRPFPVAPAYLEEQELIGRMADTLSRWCLQAGCAVSRYAVLRDLYSIDEINLYGDRAARLLKLREQTMGRK